MVNNDMNNDTNDMNDDGENGSGSNVWDFRKSSNQSGGEKPAKNPVNRSGFIIFVLMISAAVLVAVLSAIEKKTGFLKSAPVPEKTSNSDYIAVLHISGVITESGENYDQEWLLGTVENLKNDPKNQALFLNINSPGGSVYESDEAYLALSDYAKTKPVYAYFGQLAASGGYYIGCAASYIYANRNTLTGSIGVISGQSVDLTGLMEKYGVKVTTITAGKNKNMLNFNSALTEEQRSIMQSVADECYEQFVDIVASARKMDAANVRTLADGRIYTAKQALDAGLIDEIIPYDEALEKTLAKIRSDNQLQNLSAEDFEYKPKYRLIDYFIKGYSSAKSKNTAGIAGITGAVETSVLSAVSFPVSLPAYYYAH